MSLFQFPGSSTSASELATRHPARWLQVVSLAQPALAGFSLLSSLLTMVLPAQAQPTTVTLFNQATYSYTNPTTSETFTNLTNSLSNQSSLIDPLGRITGCTGELLPNYQGFSVSVYEPSSSDPTGTEIGRLVALTPTALPQSGNLPPGLQPNTQNSNPFFLSSGNPGTYNFQLDPGRGQLDPGRSYILVINPPPGSIYSQRRVRLTIQSRQGNTVTYIARAVDGGPIEATSGQTAVEGTLFVTDAAQVGLVLASLNLRTSICQAQAVQIIKTGDRSAAEPGDTVIYRLSIKNLASAAIANVTITDVLPLGFKFLPASVRAELAGNPVPITTTQSGSVLTFAAPNVELPRNGNGSRPVPLNIAYAAQLTPDALRGSGENSAIVQGQRSDNLQSVKDGPAIHRLRVRNGILSDCGTIIGRVFDDKNFDGEQQPGEPGMPNAVIFLDDGTRITTDANGLFSIANVLSGYRSGVLDLSSLPGYTLAPNLYFSERNSQSRLVRLEPGGMVRMNFGVTPAAREGNQP